MKSSCHYITILIIIHRIAAHLVASIHLLARNEGPLAPTVCVNRLEPWFNPDRAMITHVVKNKIFKENFSLIDLDRL